VARKIAWVVAGVFFAVLAATGCTSASPGVSHPVSSPSTARPGPRPNFVFVLTDDLSWNLVSHMPHVRTLQQAGATMSDYYVVDSLCCPSRSAIFTGEYPHDDGVFTNADADGGYNAFNQHGD
jgi:N-acetylglucosamine-6-sulfatase